MHTEIPSIGDIKLFISKLDIGVVEEFISKLESITTSSKATSAGSKSYVDKMLVAMSAVDAKMGGLEKQEMASKSESVSVSKDEEMASKSESVSVSKDEEMASKSESASVSKDETAVNAKMVGPEKLEMASKSESASLSKDERVRRARLPVAVHSARRLSRAVSARRNSVLLVLYRLTRRSMVLISECKCMWCFSDST